MQPAGVHDTNVSLPTTSRPMLSGWKPSTSLSAWMASMTASSSRCAGSGNCTRMPWMSARALSSSTTLSSCSCVVSVAISIFSEKMPVSAHAFTLLRT